MISVCNSVLSFSVLPLSISGKVLVSFSSFSVLSLAVLPLQFLVKFWKVCPHSASSVFGNILVIFHQYLINFHSLLYNPALEKRGGGGYTGLHLSILPFLCSSVFPFFRSSFLPLFRYAKMFLSIS